MDTSGFFETFFNNAKYNGIIVMNTTGTILNINGAFHLRFGYLLEDLEGKNFSILFTEKDKDILKPQTELKEVLTKGSGSDENYLVHKDGNKVWVTGESVLIENKEKETFVVKVVHNIHAQKQLERFLIESHEFIDTVFDSIDESALLLLDSRLRIIKSNQSFDKLFELEAPPEPGSRLSDINNSFWQNPEIKQAAVNFLTMNNVSKATMFQFQTLSGITKKISFQAKMVEGVPGVERKLLVMIKEIA